MTVLLPDTLPLDLEGLVKDEKMSIRVRGNPHPFAVGSSLVNWEILQMGGLKGVLRGKALAVTHIYGDCLCPLKGEAYFFLF